MRLDFNVLWVDDQPGAVKAQIDSIKLRMLEHGFEFQARQCKTLADVQALVSDQVFTDEIDLVLVDWNLGGGAFGENAISEIRAAVPYKDVVFYSGESPAQTLRKLAFEANLEGVYCAARAELVDEVMGVFDSLVKKVLDLDHTRGIVMGATSDIDEMVRECLLAIDGKLKDDKRVELIQSAIETVEERIRDQTDQLKALKEGKTVTNIFEAHLVYTANDRLRMLSRLIKAKVVPLNDGARATVTDYMNKVVPKRNEFGHMILEPEGRPAGISAGNGKVVTLDEARELRKLILDLRIDFKKLVQALQAA